MEKHLPKIVGSWLAGTYDRDRTVAKAATDGIQSFMITEDRLVMFWRRYQVQILEYAQDAITETPHTLSDERTLSADDVQAKYFRVVGSSISLIISLLVKLHKDEVMKHQQKYEEFLANNKKLWVLAACEDSFVRRTVDQLLIVCLDKQHDIIGSDLEIVSHAFIAEALCAAQTSSAYQLLQALEKLTAEFPHAWTSKYKGKKPPLSRIRHFIEKGSQGGPPDYWQALQSMLSNLPPGILPSDIDTCLDFLRSFRDGIGHREEPKRNSAQGWSSYFNAATILVEKLIDSTAQENLFKESIYPILEHYLHPTAENYKWSVGNNIEPLVMASVVCGSAKDLSLQQSFADEWTRLSDNLISRILTSLPEQSNDYHKSQSAIASEGHRWFVLLSKNLEQDPFRLSGQVLILPSTMIIEAALKITVNRKGKPYSAVAIVESALRISPVLLRVSPTILTLIKSFLENKLAKLILSPCSTYLVSILNLLRAIPDQYAFIEGVWQSTVGSLLCLPKDGDNLKAVTALISSDAVREVSQKDPELQGYLSEVSMRAVLGDGEAWPLFESVTTFKTLSDSAQAKLLDQALMHLDANDGHMDIAFTALEMISTKNPALLRSESKIQVTLVTRLLAMTELSDSPVAARAANLRATLRKTGKSCESNQDQRLIVHVIRENLEVASPLSLR